MSRFLVVATAGAGGDLPPLVAAALRLVERGHDVDWIGDGAVRAMLAGLGVAVEQLPAELDLGPRLAGAVHDAMTATGGDLASAGPLVEERMTQWAAEVAIPVAQLCGDRRPDVVITSLFGVEVLREVDPPCPWAVVNSTFYLGPDPPTPLTDDVSPRALPLLRRYAALLGSAALVLHATDQVFDRSFRSLPAGHHYVGPLGIWEPPGPVPAYLDDPGDPWVLLSLSSQLQDDLPLAEAALTALAERPLRVLLTLGPGHQPGELRTRPANARIEQVVPHTTVLRRSRLMVSHAGHGSVMKALWEGRPMVLAPWGRDQPGVAARAEALGVAVTVARDGADARTLGEAIDRALTDPDLSEIARAHAARLQQTDPPSAAADLLESLT